MFEDLLDMFVVCRHVIRVNKYIIKIDYNTNIYSPYRVENHRPLAWNYKANSKSNSPREATVAGIPCSLSSVWTTKRTMLLTTKSDYSGTITLTSNGMLTVPLRCALNMPTAILELAPVKVVNKYVMTLSQNELLTYLWYLNLGYTLRGLGVIQKFNNNDNEE